MELDETKLNQAVLDWLACTEGFALDAEKMMRAFRQLHADTDNIEMRAELVRAHVAAHEYNMCCALRRIREYFADSFNGISPVAACLERDLELAKLAKAVTGGASPDDVFKAAAALVEKTRRENESAVDQMRMKVGAMLATMVTGKPCPTPDITRGVESLESNLVRANSRSEYKIVAETLFKTLEAYKNNNASAKEQPAA